MGDVFIIRLKIYERLWFDKTKQIDIPPREERVGLLHFVGVRSIPLLRG
jgi:hypothetical protein